MKKRKLILLLFFPVFYACTSSTAARLEKLSDEVNRDCPMIIDAYTVCDSTSYSKKNHQFTYYFTLVNYPENPNSIDAIKQHMEQIIPESVRTNPQMEQFRRLEVKMDYRDYSSINGKLLFSISVTP